MTSATRIRIMTYNVHRCLGQDGRLSPGRIAAAVAEHEPDVVALQELDVRRARTEFVDQVAVIAGSLEMHWCFHPAYQAQDEHYGDAILSRFPIRLMRAAALPTLHDVPGLERRGALWVSVDWNGHRVQMLTTHLGLMARERLAQVESLLSSKWLADPHCRPPIVLCGDLNALPGTRPYRRLCTRLRDPVTRRVFPRGTFPSSYPVLRIDHVLLSDGWTVHRVAIPRTRLSRVASDHLPLIVEASLPASRR